MAPATLALAAVVQWTAAVVFAAVARRLAARDVTAHARPANQAFVAWWASLALYMAIQGGFALAAAAGYASVPAYLASRIVVIPALCIATWGLTFHVTYLYTGRRRLAVPIGVLYAALGVLFAYATWTADVQELTVGAWTVAPAGIDDTWPFRVVYAGVGVPPILATLLYASLAFRLEDPMQRYRVLLVSLGILAWVGGGLLARLGGGETGVFVTLVLFGLGAAVAVLLAYFPPPAVVRRLDPQARQRQAAAQALQRRRFEERTRNLV